MPLTLTICVMIFSILYFNKTDRDYLSSGIFVGIIWFIINLAFDLLMFMPESPMHMSVEDYFADIGLTYLIIPTVTIGVGYLLEKK